MQRLDQIVPGILGLLVFGLPTAYLLYLWLMRRMSHRWPVADGTVTHSALVDGGRRHVHPDVRYSYEVNGVRYEGRRVRFGGALAADVAGARATRSRYTAGQRVRVRHHPRRPGFSTLETSASPLLGQWTLFGLFMVGGIAGALLGWWE